MEKTIVRNFILNCDDDRLPEFMVKAEYTNEQGLISLDKIEGLNLFDVVDVNESVFEDFINNSLAYDYQENDLIIQIGRAHV